MQQQWRPRSRASDQDRSAEDPPKKRSASGVARDASDVALRLKCIRIGPGRREITTGGEKSTNGRPRDFYERELWCKTKKKKSKKKTHLRVY